MVILLARAKTGRTESDQNTRKRGQLSLRIGSIPGLPESQKLTKVEESRKVVILVILAPSHRGSEESLTPALRHWKRTRAGLKSGVRDDS